MLDLIPVGKLQKIHPPNLKQCFHHGRFRRTALAYKCCMRLFVACAVRVILKSYTTPLADIFRCLICFAELNTFFVPYA